MDTYIGPFIYYLHLPKKIVCDNDNKSGKYNHNQSFSDVPPHNMVSILQDIKPSSYKVSKVKPIF